MFPACLPLISDLLDTSSSTVADDGWWVIVKAIDLEKLDQQGTSGGGNFTVDLHVLISNPGHASMGCMCSN
ncbi:hypothetical protein DPMN_055300 [Dreissena polymorpha]|uniref:Uncharacterized protein n=1 Tax=Dreissena polymorpha TaxID=45954 RepID=A0A9D4CQI5_DREPO|nr:hypothetical protein DPMN_055300 [Dreissena polymorpha]